MTLHLKTAILASLLLISTTTAIAGEPDLAGTPESLSNGFYVEGYLGYGYVAAENSTFRKNGFTGGGALGYKFSDHWAIDGGYTQLPHANVATYYAYLSLKAIYPFHTHWDVFAKVGPAYVNGARNPALAASDKFALYMGLGTTYWLWDSLGIVLQGTATTGRSNIPTTYTVTLGLSYFF